MARPHGGAVLFRMERVKGYWEFDMRLSWRILEFDTSLIQHVKRIKFDTFDMFESRLKACQTYQNHVKDSKRSLSLAPPCGFDTRLT